MQPLQTCCRCLADPFAELLRRPGATSADLLQMPCRSVYRVCDVESSGTLGRSLSSFLTATPPTKCKAVKDGAFFLWCLWFSSHSSFCCDSYWSRHRCVIFLVVEVVELNNFVLVDLINHLNLVDATLSVGFRSSSSFEAGKSFGLTSDWDWETAARLMCMHMLLVRLLTCYL